MPLYREDLNPMRCQEPGCTCTEIELSSRCHPRAGTVVRYDWAAGTIKVKCAKCEAAIAAISVASRPRAN